MKAVGYQQSLPIEDERSLLDCDVPKPEPGPRDIRVAVKAVSVNPIDTKVRKRTAPPSGEYKILGYDAAGIVDAAGSEVTLFQPGDEVFYAGSVIRQGANSEFHIVDERIVGRKPRILSFAEAAALPLTSLTAWELLFERMSIAQSKNDNRTLLIIGGAGGVGSIAIQLARRFTGLTVIATASRPETIQWCLDLGAHHVIDHSRPMKEQVAKLNLPPVAWIASLTNTDMHFPALSDIVEPQGAIGVIDDTGPLDVATLKAKAASLRLESMFARTKFQTPDMAEQRVLLNRIADMIDAGEIKTTLDKVFGKINATNLRAAHATIESGKSIGKIVLEGW